MDGPDGVRLRIVARHALARTTTQLCGKEQRFYGWIPPGTGVDLG